MVIGRSTRPVACSRREYHILPILFHGKIDGVCLCRGCSSVSVSLDLAPTDAFPKPPQSPNPSHPRPLLPPSPSFCLLPPLSLPYTSNPPPQAIFHTFPLDRSRLCDKGRRDPRVTWDTFRREHRSRYEGLWGWSDGKATGETNGGQATGKLARHNGSVRKEDVSGDQVSERRPQWTSQEWWEDSAGVLQAKTVDCRRQG